MAAQVAVVTPTLNRVAMLRQALDSVREQTLTDWEHVIVDDGSDDGTQAEVERRATADARVRHVGRTVGRAGANVCRNIGIRESRAEFVVFLDSDDLLSPECLRRRVAVMSGNPDLDFAVFPGRVFTAVPADADRLFARAIAGDDLDRFLYLDYPWEITSPIWRREALNRLGGFAEDLPSWQDIDLHVRALIAGMRYARFDEPDHYIRWAYAPEKTSVKQFHSPEHLRSGMSLVQDFHTRLAEAGLLTRTRERALAGLWFLMGERWTRLDERTESRRAWLQAYRAGLASVHLSALGLMVLYAFRLRLLTPTYNERLLERFKAAVGFRFQPLD